MDGYECACICICRIINLCIYVFMCLGQACSCVCIDVCPLLCIDCIARNDLITLFTYSCIDFCIHLLIYLRIYHSSISSSTYSYGRWMGMVGNWPETCNETTQLDDMANPSINHALFTKAI